MGLGLGYRGDERVDLLDGGVAHVQPLGGDAVERRVVEHLVRVRVRVRVRGRVRARVRSRVRVRVRVRVRSGVRVGVRVSAVLSSTTTESALSVSRFRVSSEL